MVYIGADTFPALTLFSTLLAPNYARLLTPIARRSADLFSNTLFTFGKPLLKHEIMSSQTVIPVDFEDRNHPKYEASKQNALLPFIRKFPVEVCILGIFLCYYRYYYLRTIKVRQAIYEYAVYVDHPIEPQPVVSLSNKFVWGKSKKVRGYLEPDEEALTVVSLARTCRFFYVDIEICQPFYKINLFQFSRILFMHSYLAAISPQRREAIRYIELKACEYSRSFWHLDHLGIQRSVYSVQTDEDVLALMSHGAQTEDRNTQLRELSLTVSIQERELSRLQRCLIFANKYDETMSAWNLSCFRLQLVYERRLFQMGNPMLSLPQTIPQVDRNLLLEINNASK